MRGGDAQPTYHGTPLVMCLACGFLCCALDAFEGCGCDFCSEPGCWSEEEDGGDERLFGE